ncbi:hypothetical protein SDC9_136001 [bioreactor metagenome]|uniref:Uncharacterized protein n=1 Tax=bioreactor metagenome TaxID=1076179 RepID=A0A645DI07_9ZZZZ
MRGRHRDLYFRGDLIRNELPEPLRPAKNAHPAPTWGQGVRSFFPGARPRVRTFRSGTLSMDLWISRSGSSSPAAAVVRIGKTVRNGIGKCEHKDEDPKGGQFP